MTFYFYDLETTGFSPRTDRIVQFGGQRTDMNLKPIGNPDNIYIKITPDILPDPYAALVTGITPQKTLTDGITEAEFTKYFYKEIAQAGTIFVGFNSIRFDDEFMRHILYRNFYDPYEWQWQDNRSRWDILDVVRMTRALRPDGIKWPFDSSGAPSNQLGLLTSINKLDHSNAHDALSDVQATIEVAKLIKSKQPKLFEYLLKMRTKDEVSKLVNSGEPFVYTSGKYPSEYEKTTVAIKLADHPKRQGILVYDLRYDPNHYLKLKPGELAEAWSRRDPAEGVILPIKTMQFNRCPAVAPLSTLDEKSQQRLKIDLDIIDKNTRTLSKLKDWTKQLFEALEILDKKQQERFFTDVQDIDNQLYDNFFDGNAKRAMSLVRSAEPEELGELKDSLKDKRLQTLLPLYKARNYPKHLTSDERVAWDEYVSRRLIFGGQESRLAKYFKSIEDIKAQPNLNGERNFILEELQLYGESILPA